MRQTRLLTGMVVALLLAACQAGTAATNPGPTAPTNPPSPPSDGAAPVALSGTITFAQDSTNGSGGSTTETHQHLSANVSLAAEADNPFTFADDGSTFSYTETLVSNDPQTTSSCGLHQESTGTGSGHFGPAGSISASYGDNSPEVHLSIKAPYSSDFSSTFLCNGLTSANTSDEVTDNLTCNTGGTGWLAGTIEPGNVMKIAPGQVIDFACTETLAIGSGAIVVSGTLTSS